MIGFNEEVRISTIPDGEVSASLNEYKKDKYAILLNDGLMLYLIDVSILTAILEIELVENFNAGDIFNIHISKSLQLFEEKIGEYKNNEEYKKSIFIDKVSNIESFYLYKILVYISKLVGFVISHEISHASLGHLKETNINQLNLEDEADLNALFISKKPNYSGFKILDRVMNEDSEYLPFVFFTFSSIMEDSSKNMTHFNSMSRLFRLGDIIYNEYGYVRYSVVMSYLVVVLYSLSDSKPYEKMISYFKKSFAPNGEYDPSNLPDKLKTKNYKRNEELISPPQDAESFFLKFDKGYDISVEPYKTLSLIRTKIMKAIYLIIIKDFDNGYKKLQESYVMSKNIKSIKFMYLSALLINSAVVLFNPKLFPAKEWTEHEKFIYKYMFDFDSPEIDAISKASKLFKNNCTVRMVTLSNQFTISKLSTDYKIISYVYESVFGSNPDTLHLE